MVFSMKYKNLTVIGTSHIAVESINEVKTEIEKKPSIVAVELDKKRFYALLDKKRRGVSISDIRRIGFVGFLFVLIGSWVQKKLGKMVGVMPGSEMINAVRLAKKNKLKIALIDRDIEITLRRLSLMITRKEKLRFVADFFKAIFFRKREMKKYGIETLDLTKVPSTKIIVKMIKHLKKDFPNVYKVLIKERDAVMAKNLFELMGQNPDEEVLAVVGAGHEKEIIRIVKGMRKI